MYKDFLKRVFDFTLSLVALIMLSPIFLILIITGRIVMKGSPFFTQERPGYHGKIFKLIKFRSMTEEKDENGNYLPDEKRLTKYGELLRKTSLDEIPELINILKGDMAIVGPRPLLVQYLPLYNEEQHHRHDVRPGLTGLAQINGRFNILWQEKFKYDLEYVNNITLLGDIKIILKTVGIVFEKDDVENDEMGSWYPFLGNDVEDQQITYRKQKNKEIGSEFWNIPLTDKDNSFFNDETKWFISGRAALDYIIKDLKAKNKINTVALPSWCCKSMIKPFIENNINIKFYSVIYKDNKLIKDLSNIKDCDVLLNIDYFGYKTNDNIKFDGVIINDITHSMFTDENNNSYDYVFGSLRKWAGFITGGFAYCKDGFNYEQYIEIDEQYLAEKKQAMKLKDDYINGLSRTKDYLEIFNKCEERLDSANSFGAYQDDIDNAKRLDIEFIKNKRQENAKELLTHLKEYAIFKEVNKDDCPLFVPIIVPNGKRDELRKYLIKNKIYCPVHWPISNLHNLSEEEKYIYDNELSIVCDQRYNVDDMKLICNKIEEFFKC